MQKPDYQATSPNIGSRAQASNLNVTNSKNEDKDIRVQNEIIQILRVCGNKGLTNTEILTELEKRGINKQYFDRVRTKMIINQVAVYKSNRLFLNR